MLTTINPKIKDTVSCIKYIHVCSMFLVFILKILKNNDQILFLLSFVGLNILSAKRDVRVIVMDVLYENTISGYDGLLRL